MTRYLITEKCRHVWTAPYPDKWILSEVQWVPEHGHFLRNMHVLSKVSQINCIPSNHIGYHGEHFVKTFVLEVLPYTLSELLEESASYLCIYCGDLSLCCGISNEDVSISWV